MLPGVIAVSAMAQPSPTPGMAPDNINGVWKVEWTEALWKHGSAFEIEDGKIKGTPFLARREKDRLLLTQPDRPEGLSLQLMPNGNWTAKAGARTITITRLEANPRLEPQKADLNGTWSLKIYGGKDRTLVVSEGRLTGLSAGENRTQFEGKALVLSADDGTVVRVYMNDPRRWIGFGQLPKEGPFSGAEQLSGYRPVVLMRNGAGN
jgi:hypothetical protein